MLSFSLLPVDDTITFFFFVIVNVNAVVGIYDCCFIEFGAVEGALNVMFWICSDFIDFNGWFNFYFYTCFATSYLLDNVIADDVDGFGSFSYYKIDFGYPLIW